MIPGKKYTPEEIVAMVWRRKWIVLLPFLVIGASTYFWAKSLPDSYRSETMIMVVPQRVPEQYVKPATTESIEDRLGTIREQILSRTRLERIITDLNLYADLRRHYLMEDLIEQMRDDIAITVARDDSFRVAYVSSNPVMAMKVTEQLASAFIEQNLKDRAGPGTGHQPVPQHAARRRPATAGRAREEARGLPAGTFRRAPLTARNQPDRRSTTRSCRSSNWSSRSIATRTAPR